VAVELEEAIGEVMVEVGRMGGEEVGRRADEDVEDVEPARDRVIREGVADTAVDEEDVTSSCLIANRPCLRTTGSSCRLRADENRIRLIGTTYALAKAMNVRIRIRSVSGSMIVVKRALGRN
jgi:hypothetical protein